MGNPSNIHFATQRENVQLMVLNLGQRQVILGMPWLQKWNPQVDWLAKTLTIPQEIKRRGAVPLCECLPSETESTIP